MNSGCYCCCCCSGTQLCTILHNPWTAAHQASLSHTVSQSLPKFTSTALVMPSSHVILWCPLLLPPSIFPSIRHFSNKSAIHIRWSLIFTGALALASVLPMSIQGWFPLKLTGLIILMSKGLSGVFYCTAVERHQFFGALPSLWSSFHNSTWPLGRPQPWLYERLSAE